ncbi:TPA: 3-isopropylmalate dehydratase small subunit [Streptococcus suis]|uniref:3-isopropylmalate dehydratase small subunit n=1 Tax=Streptococcus suis TaxID=1307 RepID=A0AB33U3Z5_STRSU|nr:3-isopropylmalate dehydratase small subunit [Streptococcus suis]NQG10990.1 3-isopropylmalate dehydratase small subunit [Streptococcus suis]NQH86509.1 3-isopropylmalate dehydratase small subunit [Streptococcus suis]NQN17338.1 3-isopropylmalate dehydratase small subunit [Streptococcus suis]NQR25976.1 3-isopropylmalate dehydratase small subunit [Streptococcus suis]NQR70979.1 3-isopropylmalate dehydratase small subunit [Streptococcus suis]
MHQFTTWTGTTVPLMNDNIDTDQLLPKQFLKLIDKKGFGKYLLYAWRYLDDNYTDNPDFILNQPEYQGASILISGDNFGAGSSREHAAWALADYGFKVIIAGSFGDIHYNNDLNNGILPIIQPKEVRDQLAQLTPDQEITVDLADQLIRTPFGEFPFDIELDWKHKLLNGLDDIGITLQYQDLIAEYEDNRPSYWQE